MNLMVRCNSCGVDNPDTATYCLNCGRELKKGSNEVKCKSCGTSNPDTATYCFKCGTELKKDVAEVMCGSCGVNNPAKATYCLNCGKDLKDSGSASGGGKPKDHGGSPEASKDDSGENRDERNLSDLSEDEIKNLPDKELKELVKKRVKKEKAIKELSQLEGVGISRAGTLYENGYDSIEEIKDASEEELQGIPGVGPKLSEMIKESVEKLDEEDLDGCSNCGKDNPITANYCIECGTQIGTGTISYHPEDFSGPTKKCSRCSVDNPEEANYCFGCGGKIDNKS